MKQVLFIGAVWPEPESSAAGTRTCQLVRGFLHEGYPVRFVSSAAQTVHSAPLEQWGVTINQILLNDSSFDQQLLEWQPDIVIFDRFMMEEQYGWRINEQCPNAVKILDTIDLHFLRKGREKAYKEQEEYIPFKTNDSLSFREMASILRCDLTLLISYFEFEWLSKNFPIPESIFCYLPIHTEPIPEETQNQFPTFHSRKHFVTLGNWRHEPNRQSVIYLNKIWPKIKAKIPDAELFVYGANTAENAQSFHKPREGFYIMGRVKSVKDIFTQHRVLLAPLFFGAGIKGKILDGMQFGLPNVTTTLGAEGMHIESLWNGLIADEKDFIEKAIRLYQNKELWEDSVRNGFEINNKLFADRTPERNFYHQLKNIVNDLESHRQQNLMGQLLQHHTLMSHRYMSKWIELKNKVQN
ncbi:MAG: glycosyltransferase [Flavobacterium sp.]